MPYIEIPVQKTRTFVPPEAHQIAGRWRGIAAEIREIAAELKGIETTLNDTWEGDAKARFMQQFSPLPGNVESCAQLLESLAGQVESITVTEVETVMERVWDSSVGAQQ